MSGLAETKDRDQLAVQRTRLANERTLLAYVRTALGLMGAGLLLGKLITGRSALVGAVALFATGAGVLVIGVMRFRHVRQQIADSGAT
jgi:putative membrane protein